MSLQTFTKSISLRRPVAEVFAWHERAGALERLTPPWERVEVLEQTGGIRDGGRVVLRSKVGPFWSRWEVEHRGYDEKRVFRDVLLKGPFAFWEHAHRFKIDSAASCTLTDEINYRLPLGFLGRAGSAFARSKLERLFAYRHAVLAEDLAMVESYGSVRSMRFLVSGASGLVGRALVPFLRSQGHEVIRLVRHKAHGPDEVFWDPEKGVLDLASVRMLDAVVHLAGANVAEGRWTAARREEIRASRVLGTRTLVTALDRLRHRPFVLVTASATGFYGDAGDKKLFESDKRGSGFLADVCEAWEREAAVSRGFGIRVAKLRTGVVLSPAGGALAKLLPLFSAGLGGRISSGNQWMSWISIDDMIGAIYHAVLDQRCNGPVNAVAPEPVTNAEFTATLAHVLRRPAILPVPTAALHLAFGAMADETLLASARVMPGRLTESQFYFRHIRLEQALRHLLGR
ncbi:MAG: TIGR01777 family protein [Verrucomicrobia bacterium]|nr:TIGR01777 family protein [Verrucomicrobiota bacterium]